MKFFTALFLACLIAATNATYDAPSKAEVNTMIRKLKSYFRTDSVTFNHVPTAVRLAFHDCVGYACDGCINLDNASNNGLSAYLTWIEDIYTSEAYDAIVSRADFCRWPPSLPQKWESPKTTTMSLLETAMPWIHLTPCPQTS